MKNYYKLQILIDPSAETFNNLTAILGVQPREQFSNFSDSIPFRWTYEVFDDKVDEYFDFINVFLDLLETKYTDLKKLNIKRNDISIWLLYEYDQQCNLEFQPKGLKRLGDNGITLCVSCWDSGKEYSSENQQ
jgi:hypothetical protein